MGLGVFAESVDEVAQVGGAVEDSRKSHDLVGDAGEQAAVVADYPAIVGYKLVVGHWRTVGSVGDRVGVLMFPEVGLEVGSVGVDFFLIEGVRVRSGKFVPEAEAFSHVGFVGDGGWRGGWGQWG